MLTGVARPFHAPHALFTPSATVENMFTFIGGLSSRDVTDRVAPRRLRCSTRCPNRPFGDGQSHRWSALVMGRSEVDPTRRIAPALPRGPPPARRDYRVSWTVAVGHLVVDRVRSTLRKDSGKTDGIRTTQRGRPKSSVTRRIRIPQKQTRFGTRSSTATPTMSLNPSAMLRSSARVRRLVVPMAGRLPCQGSGEVLPCGAGGRVGPGSRRS